LATQQPCHGGQGCGQPGSRQLDCTWQRSNLATLVRARGSQAPGSWLTLGNAAALPSSSLLKVGRLQATGLDSSGLTGSRLAALPSWSGLWATGLQAAGLHATDSCIALVRSAVLMPWARPSAARLQAAGVSQQTSASHLATQQCCDRLEVNCDDGWHGLNCPGGRLVRSLAVLVAARWRQDGLTPPQQGYLHKGGG